MSGEPRNVGRYLVPEVSEARLARQYAVVRERAGKPAPLAVRRGALGLVAVCALVATVLLLRAPQQQAIDGATVHSGAGAGQVIELADGSRVELSADSTMKLARVSAGEVRLVLEHGSLSADVTHRADRTFVVQAGGYSVRVVGTKFSVAWVPRSEAPQVEVRVERGRVVVSDPAGTMRALDAGESWRSAAVTGPAERASSAPAFPGAQPTQGPDAQPPPAASASASAAAGASASSTAAEPGQAPAPPGPKELLEAAQAARAAGRPREAASAYDAIRRRFRGDGRAGLAAFELGRLRMDALGDAGGAIEALTDALVLSPGAPFREDAEARRAQAMARAGRVAQCQQARDAYLARYPRGVHRATVAGLCGGP